MDKQKLGIIITALSASGFGTMPILAKIAYSHGSNVITLLSIRFIIASALFLLAIKLLKLPWGVNYRQVVGLFIVGAIGYVLFSSLYFYGVSVIPASLASLLLYTYPTIVCIFAWLLGDEKMFFQKVIALIVSGIGLFFILGPSVENIALRGVVAVLGAAVTYGLYIVIMNRFLKNVHWLTSSTIVCISAAVIFSLGGAISGQIIYTVPMTVVMSGLGLALFSTVLGIGGLYVGIGMIGPSKVAIVSTIEPVVTVILAAIFFNEILLKEQFLGGTLILASILIIQLYKHKTEQTGTTEEDTQVEAQGETQVKASIRKT
jgi:drug/metabolite transporter (DMT)-like permease